MNYANERYKQDVVECESAGAINYHRMMFEVKSVNDFLCYNQNTLSVPLLEARFDLLSQESLTSRGETPRHETSRMIDEDGMLITNSENFTDSILRRTSVVTDNYNPPVPTKSVSSGYNKADKILKFKKNKKSNVILLVWRFHKIPGKNKAFKESLPRLIGSTRSYSKTKSRLIFGSPAARSLLYTTISFENLLNKINKYIEIQKIQYNPISLRVPQITRKSTVLTKLVPQRQHEKDKAYKKKKFSTDLLIPS